jgi:hypothetical protein
MGNKRKFDLRLPDDQMSLMKQTAKNRGFRSANAYVQAVIVRDMRDSASDHADRQAYTASLDRLTKEIRTVHTTQQAIFAVVDSLTRLFLTCIPEPPPNGLDQAKRRARMRYDRFLLSVAQNMTSDSRATLTELVDDALGAGTKRD